MKKIVAVVALVAASFAAPALPTQAATMLEEMNSNCLIFPMLKAECRAEAEAMFMERRAAMTSAVEDGMSFAPPPPPPMMAPPPAPPMMSEPPAMPSMMFGPCSPAPAGSGYLLDC